MTYDSPPCLSCDVTSRFLRVFYTMTILSSAQLRHGQRSTHVPLRSKHTNTYGGIKLHIFALRRTELGVALRLEREGLRRTEPTSTTDQDGARQGNWG
jgi:hypothetical protein